jgi:ABC-type taurine transport system ATPase subunit
MSDAEGALTAMPLRDDNPSEIDLLGFEDVVDLVEEIVTRPDLDPVTVGVNAPWGGGKTTVLQRTANIVLGGTQGSDSLGYDFEVRGRSRRTLYFEVKSLVGEAGDLAEFELGETEVVAAQRRRDSYRILLVCGVLESTSRQIFELPNPSAGRGAGRYTLLGRGLRYRCAFQR